MTSEKKRAANRCNGKRSTGPKSAGGKARSAKNAVKHGLASSVLADELWESQVRDLAACIAGPDPNELESAVALRIAEAQTAIIRVRYFRTELINKHLGDSFFLTRRGDRLTRRLLQWKYSNAGRAIPNELFDALEDETPSSPAKLPAVLEKYTVQLTRLDQYEHRALSRRAAAIREFDRIRNFRMRGEKGLLGTREADLQSA